MATVVTLLLPKTFIPAQGDMVRVEDPLLILEMENTNSGLIHKANFRLEIWLEIWLENSLEIWLEILFTGKSPKMSSLQGSSNRRTQGSVNFVPAVAYYF